MKNERMNNDKINRLLRNGLPPSSIESEKCLLGSIMINPKVLDDIYWNHFSIDAFFKMAHKTIFVLMLEAKEKKGTLELADFHKLLEEKKLLVIYCLAHSKRILILVRL